MQVWFGYLNSMGALYMFGFIISIAIGGTALACAHDAREEKRKSVEK